MALAAVCQNLASLQSVTFKGASESGPQCDLGTLFWDAANEKLRDAQGVQQKALDTLSVFVFSNGARIIVAVNSSLTFTPPAGAADNSSALAGPERLAAHLGFDFENVTG